MSSRESPLVPIASFDCEDKGFNGMSSSLMPFLLMTLIQTPTTRSFQVQEPRASGDSRYSSRSNSLEPSGLAHANSRGIDLQDLRLFYDSNSPQDAAKFAKGLCHHFVFFRAKSC